MDAGRDGERDTVGDENEPASGIREAPGLDSGDLRGGRDAHHALNNPVGEPDPTEWPDPYERRPDPRFPPSAEAGASPHTAAAGDERQRAASRPRPRAHATNAPDRDRLDA